MSTRIEGAGWRVATSVGVLAALAGGAAYALYRPLPAEAAPAAVTVYKSPSCACCGAWIEHMREAGYTLRVRDTDEMAAVKAEQGVPARLGSCHTAVVGGYAVEGHVPAEVIGRLLAERPAAAGIAVPGMPAGSPGMEGAGKQPYDVLAFDRAGRTSVFSRQ